MRRFCHPCITQTFLNVFELQQEIWFILVLASKVSCACQHTVHMAKKLKTKSWGCLPRTFVFMVFFYFLIVLRKEVKAIFKNSIGLDRASLTQGFLIFDVWIFRSLGVKVNQICISDDKPFLLLGNVERRLLSSPWCYPPWGPWLTPTARIQKQSSQGCRVPVHYLYEKIPTSRYAL